MNLDELARDATTKLQAGEVNELTIPTIVKSVIFGSNSAATWDVNDDSGALGLQKKDLREEIKKVL